MLGGQDITPPACAFSDGDDSLPKMIADTFAQSRRYTSLSPRFAAAFAFLEKLAPDAATGRHEIDGDDCFALVQTYHTKSSAQAKFEAHRKYIDIQFVQSGRETLYWTPLSAITETTQPYADEKDVALFATPARFTALNLQAGEFAIFFPEDAHAPGIELEGVGEVRKVVIKVSVH